MGGDVSLYGFVDSGSVLTLGLRSLDFMATI